MKSLIAAMLWVLFIGAGIIGCSASDSNPGRAAEIPASSQTVNFEGGTEGPVFFSHATHANEYYDGVCITCHDHEDIGTETHWSCRDCHEAGNDIESLCEGGDANHGCIMIQCENCHLLEGPPAPDGVSCGADAGGCHS